MSLIGLSSIAHAFSGGSWGWCRESASNHGALVLMQELRWRTMLLIEPWTDPANHPSSDKRPELMVAMGWDNAGYRGIYYFRERPFMSNYPRS